MLSLMRMCIPLPTSTPMPELILDPRSFFHPPCLILHRSCFGDNNSSGSFDNGSLHTNPSPEYAGSGENLASNDTAPTVPGGHFMFPAHLPFSTGTSTDPDVDPPASPVPPATGSSSDLQPSVTAPAISMSTPCSATTHATASLLCPAQFRGRG